MKRVLYAEDDYANRKLVSLQLRRHGWDCLLADSGEAALKLLETEVVDAVILDYNMPGLSGGETFLRLRTLNPGLKVLALTSDDSLTTSLTALGFFRVIIKPLLDDRLIDALNATQA